MNRLMHTLSTLAAGVWLGGMVLLGPIVAKHTFRMMRTFDVAYPDAMAGKVMAASFVQFDKVQLICAGLLLLSLGIVAVSARRKFAPVTRLCIAIVATGFLAYSVQFLTPKITSMQDEVATAETESKVRATFDEFHESAVLISKINLFLLAVLILSLGWTGPPRTTESTEEAQPTAPNP